MKKSLLVVCAIHLAMIVSAKDVYIKGILPDNLTVSSIYPAPSNKCIIRIGEQGSSDEPKIINAYQNVLYPAYIAKGIVSEKCTFIFVDIQAYGYKRHTQWVSITNEKDKSIVNLGNIPLKREPTPRIENIIFSKDGAGCVTYIVAINNPTKNKYFFTEMNVKISINYSFKSSGLTSNSIKYQLADKIFLHPKGTISGEIIEAYNNEKYSVPVDGNINIKKAEDLFNLSLKITTQIELPEMGINYIQFGLPRSINMISDVSIASDSLFDGRKINLININLLNIKKTLIEFKSSNNEIPIIAFEK
jgi:hypothetical protein